MDSQQNWSEVQILINPQRVSPMNSPKRLSPENRQYSPKRQSNIQSSIQNLTQKINVMQNSIPYSDVTNVSVNNFTLEKEEISLKQLDKKYSDSQKQYSSNLQALKYIHRNIEKNQNIKIQCKTQFPLVRAVAVGQFGWTQMSKQNHKQLVDIIWTDTYVTEELVNRLRPYQRVNHFPYSSQMGRKDYLFSNLNKMRNRLPQEYDFYAKTWIFPEDYQKFKQQTQIPTNGDQKMFYIAKPVASCQGKGIHLGKRQQILYHNSQNKLLVQEYMANTLLVQGLKFDLRIYVLIVSLQPLKIYVYRQGLTRLATNKYQKPDDNNYKNGRMHLTNYAINKNNPEFVHNKDFRKDKVGHKRSLASVYQDIQKLGGNSDTIKEKINSIIVKTILAVYQKMTYLQRLAQKNPSFKQPAKGPSIIESTEDGFFSSQKQPKSLKINCEKGGNQAQIFNNKPDNTNKCFELLGFDIMIDNNFEPKLIEINHQPSLTASSPLDYIIKKYLLIDLFNLLNVKSKDKENYLNKKRDSEGSGRAFDVKGIKKQIVNQISQEAQSQQGGFTLVYPSDKKYFMKTYHQIMPILILHENHQLKLKKGQSFWAQKASKQIIQQLSFRQNKTSIAKKRKQYACNYINMLSNNGRSVVQKQIIQKHIQKISQKITKQACITIQPKSQIIFSESDRKVSQPAQCIFSTIKCPPASQRSQLTKLTQFSLPKKNLNFTIKYKRNHKSSNSKSMSMDSTQTNSLASPQANGNLNSPQRMKSIIPKFTLYNSKLTFTDSKALELKYSNLHNGYNTQGRHTSNQNRANIKLSKQKNQYFDKLQLSTKNIVSEILKNQSNDSQGYIHYQSSLLKNRSSKDQQRIIYQDKSQKNNKQKQQKFEYLKMKSSGKRNEYYDRMYEKQLVSRIKKMKTMKQKLERLKKTYDKQDDQAIISKDQLKVNKLIILDKRASALNSNSKQEKPILVQQNPAQIRSIQKKINYQTIRILQFEDPSKKRNINTEEKYYQQNFIIEGAFPKDSVEMFKDQVFQSNKTKKNESSLSNKNR